MVFNVNTPFNDNDASPIENANVRLYYLDGELRTELSTTAGGGIVLDLPYSDLIHIRNGYGANAFLALFAFTI